MIDAPLVSVCIPCHNAGRYVAEALDSVLGQTYSNIEIVVVDDDSNDDSPEILKNYAARGATIISEKCGTASRARNRAFREAQGDYIKFFDADDILSPNMIEEQVKRLGGRTDAVAVSEWGRFYGDVIDTFRREPQPTGQDMPSVNWLVESAINARAMMQAGMFLVPRTLAQEAGPWDETLTLIDDFEYFCRLLCHGEDVLFVQGATLFYRSGMPESLSAEKSRKAYESQCKSLLLGTGYILAKRSDAMARLACANTCQQGYYDFYPEHPDLCVRMAERIKQCGGSNLPPSGGKVYQLLCRVLGWRLAKRAMRMAGR